MSDTTDAATYDWHQPKAIQPVLRPPVLRPPRWQSEPVPEPWAIVDDDGNWSFPQMEQKFAELAGELADCLDTSLTFGGIATRLREFQAKYGNG